MSDQRAVAVSVIVCSVRRCCQRKALNERRQDDGQFESGRSGWFPCLALDEDLRVRVCALGAGRFGVCRFGRGRAQVARTGRAAGRGEHCTLHPGTGGGAQDTAGARSGDTPGRLLAREPADGLTHLRCLAKAAHGGDHPVAAPE
ncbi:hypothetical protein ACH4JS_22705 [Streptomyces sp. NPDC017638]|uniref:hypothetical protein n=1 Tax=Streptomyces sp. NPDC017638 TaxID=3365004 RepID=UPI00378B1BFC